MIRAIAWDFDGVLADTMEDNYRAWCAALGDIGLRREEYFPLEGMSGKEMAKKICDGRGIDGDYETISKRKTEHYMRNNTFRIYPGIEPLVAALAAQKVPMAIVSGAEPSRLRTTAGEKFLANFSAIVGHEHRGRGKPTADPYLAGARMLGVQPEECVAVENAPLGVQSAKAAGMYCIGILTTNTKETLIAAGADEIVHSVQELRERLFSLVL